MCYDKQAEAEMKEVFQDLWIEKQQAKSLLEKKDKKIITDKKRRKTKKELWHYKEMQISDNKSKKSVSHVAKNVES